MSGLYNTGIPYTGNYNNREEYVDSEAESISSNDISIGEVEMDKLIFRDISIVVSSMDRDWYNKPSETPYNFNVKLGSSGLQNGYSIVSYEPKNVVALGVEKLILNNRKLNVSYSNAKVDMTESPYLLLNVNNIDYTIYGTNKYLENTLGLMMPLTPLPDSLSETNFIEFKNTLGKAKEFLHNPLASLPKLDITINTPLGDNPNNLIDVLNIKSITYQEQTSSNVATEYLMVQTTTFFPIEQYKIGDTIKFQNYVYRDTGTYNEATDFNNFINRDAGHKIIVVKSNDSDKLLKNRIYFSAPNEISTVTGNVAETSWYTSLKSKSLGDISLANSVTDTSGKLINCNLQTHVIFKVKIMDKESNFMKQLI